MLHKADMAEKPTETHPLLPFVPPDARVLILGSFPPPQSRWKMPFYYPNFNNDFWRICGLVFFDDKNHFVDLLNKSFYQHSIEQFLTNHGIAIYDAAVQVQRLADNAADKFLKVVQPSDVAAVLARLPHCQSIVITGEKAGEILWQRYGSDGQQNPPKVGQFAHLHIADRVVRVYRLPSSSRAYPLALEKKAAVYASVFAEIGLLGGESAQENFAIL